MIVAMLHGDMDDPPITDTSIHPPPQLSFECMMPNFHECFSADNNLFWVATLFKIEVSSIDTEQSFSNALTLVRYMQLCSGL